ncbi:MAG: type IV secretory system conjugative DNA transfer family protein, partial [Paracoccaceae bacterium]|nr:type IV secretory system conjugative DNA transfer family protein [Paracoccaceae bacterium]
HKHRLLMMMDEFPILGRLGAFQTSMAFLGGYGIKVYLIAQDTPQITAAYGQHESIIGNCHIRIYYTPNRLETAEPLSRSFGKTTVITEQITESGSRFGATLGEVSRSYREVERDLLTPDELLALPQPVKNADGSKIVEPGAAIVSVAGRRPIYAKQSLWFLDPVLREREAIRPAPIVTAPPPAAHTPEAPASGAFKID